MNDILEMLDALEGAVGRLGAERSALAASLRDAERRLKTISDAASPASGRRKPATAPRRKTSQPEAPGQPAATTPAAEVPPETPAETPARPTPRRQALGRGLSQLRRLRSSPEPGT